MKLRLIFAAVLTALACNSVFLATLLPVSVPIKATVCVLLFVFYVALLIRPSLRKREHWKLAFLSGGANLLFCVAFAALIQLIVYLGVLLGPGGFLAFPLPVWIANTCVFLVLVGTMIFHATMRLFAASGQLTNGHRLRLILLWWLPIGNLFAFWPVYKTVRQEYQTAFSRQERNRQREAEQICATKYPLLMIHGIFFRDWSLWSYWGRIPSELKVNGAQIHYGGQESSAGIETCAAQLKTRILEILEATGCEKLNLIAHSRGGLDARYAISCLGMGECVASLTTVNTPHQGSPFAKKGLDALPEPVIKNVSHLYNQIFSHLGDKDPDFYSGVSELTAEACAVLNEQMADDSRVFYQSVGSKMAGADSAGFPLNLGHQVIRAQGEENDGLVGVSSMRWGEFHFWEPTGGRGISHGDVIDLTRKDIPGFDVCECYVQLVKGLKDRGF